LIQAVTVTEMSLAYGSTATGGIQIAAQGPRGFLLFFWGADGTATWHPEQIAGPGMQGGPAMAAGNGTEEIALTATDGSLRYYWSYDGTPT